MAEATLYPTLAQLMPVKAFQQPTCSLQVHSPTPPVMHVRTTCPEIFAHPHSLPIFWQQSKTTTITQDSTHDWGYVYVIGGDSFIKTTDEDAGQRGGGYTNDVWVSEGSGWEIYSEGTKPMAESTMQWDEVNPGRLPPADITYEEWIICQARQRTGGEEGFIYRREYDTTTAQPCGLYACVYIKEERAVL